MLSGQQGYTGGPSVGGRCYGTSPLQPVFSQSAVELPYVTVGSGSLSAMAMFEGKFRTDTEEEEAKKLVSEPEQVVPSVTWVLEVTSISLSSARASWPLSTRTRRPKRSGAGVASTGVRKDHYRPQ